MSNSRWSLLEIEQQVCSKLSINPPTVLDAAEIANNQMYEDLIDITHNVVQRLMIRLWPEEVTGHRILLLEKGITADLEDLGSSSRQATFLVSSITAEGIALYDRISNALDSSHECIIHTHNMSYLITGYSGPTVGRYIYSIDSTYIGEDYGATDTVFVYTRNVALPSDYHKMLEDPKGFFTSPNLTLVGADVLSRKDYRGVSVGSIEATPRVAAITGDINGLNQLTFDRPPTEDFEFQINYYKTIAYQSPIHAVSPTAANAIFFPIQSGDQEIIVHSILEEIFSYKSKDSRYPVAYGKKEALADGIKNSKQLGRVATRVHPVGPFRRRRKLGSPKSVSSLAQKYDLGDHFDRID